MVVVNFLNKNNAADQRVFELLSEKLQLFFGVFGASDEVLGAIESGVDFERRIVSIYQTCRSTDEIETAFESLHTEMEETISATMDDTRQKLLENFDAEIHDRLKTNMTRANEYLDRFARMLWAMAKHELKGRPHPLCHRHSPQTDANQRGGAGASPATACPPTAYTPFTSEPKNPWVI